MSSHETHCQLALHSFPDGLHSQSPLHAFPDRMHAQSTHAWSSCARALAMCVVAIVVAGVASAQDRAVAAKEAAGLARRTAAERLPLPIERLVVVRTTPAEWRDSSLGCPARGMVYTPALVSGYTVTLRDGEREHVVHVAGGRAVLCGSQGDPKQSPLPQLAASRKAGAAVQAALAARLDIDTGAVRVVSTRVMSSDAPECGAAPSAGAGAAFLVEARAMDRTYRYYADDETTVACDAPKP
jgi:hypothetical protein